MTTTVAAIYEQGVLRLIQPLSLAEGTRVDVIVITQEPTAEDRMPADILVPCAVNTQRVTSAVHQPGEPRGTPPNWRGNCRAQHLATIAALPMGDGGEEFSGRDHDKILYGDTGAR